MLTEKNQRFPPTTFFEIEPVACPIPMYTDDDDEYDDDTDRESAHAGGEET